jgi:glycosyltransferase involved in cell wall biosynthesis
MVNRTLNGLKKAAFVTCVSSVTRDSLIGYELIPSHRIAVVPNGVHPSCSTASNPAADVAAAELLGKAPADRSEGESNEGNGVELLHVGSTIPRKRIDVLLRVFSRIREAFPLARLIRAGGGFTPHQQKLLAELGLEDAVVVLPHVEREVLAAVYRRASLLLLPSEREGFGLPVVEAMACGTPVVATDLPVLREVGGDSARYCQLDDIDEWAKTVSELITERNEHPEKWMERKQKSVANASRFSWSEYALKMVEIYEEVLARAKWHEQSA